MVLFEVERKFTETNQFYLETMYSAFLFLLYYGLFRVGELASGRHPVQARDIHQSTNKNKLLFILRSSKTHKKNSRPQRVEIEGEVNLQCAITENYYCPYLGTREYLQVRGPYTNTTDLCLFSATGHQSNQQTSGN